ncbi:MAG: hypothetical protein LBJ64_00905 [Deltaproteobacteria bacterium]|jgi:hypothetical protein|nr:hypothetical protein [Deltaproteobacteria bacterium]
MSSKLQITMTITDAETNQETTVEVECDNLPSTFEFAKLGFPDAFNALESAAIQCANEAKKKIVEKQGEAVSLEALKKTQSEPVLQAKRRKSRPQPKARKLK